MKIVFMGSPDFAVPSLEALVEARFDVPLVVTQPDRPAGRGRKMLPTAVKAVALEKGIPVHAGGSHSPGYNNDNVCVQHLIRVVCT